MREPTMTTMDDRAIADYTAFACRLAELAGRAILHGSK
jgi:hypothetical protein